MTLAKKLVSNILYKNLKMKILSEGLIGIIFLIILSHCSKSQPDKFSQLTGIWINVFDNSNRIEISKEGYFNRLLNDKNTLEPSTIVFEENPEGMFEENIYGKLKIKITNTRYDTIFYALIGDENNKIYSNGIFIFRNNELLEITYKNLPGIGDHIDEMSLYEKYDNKLKQESATNQDDKTRVEKIFIPKGYIGSIYISYNQVDGKDIQFDSLDNPLLFIQNDGTLRTKLKEDPFVMAKQMYEFYEIDSITGQINRLVNLQHGDLRRIRGEINRGEGDLMINHNIEERGMFVYGFNQVGRDYLEREKFGRQIKGNVLSLEVDTIKERLKLDWYSEKIKN